MDVTVTTPLEMNVGQQKYVVAYTLKQGTESKQPDILSAQKSDNIDSVQKLGSPAAIRPDALFTSTSSPSSSSTHKNNSSSNHHHHHYSGKSNEHQVTSSSSPPPSSHHGTLKYNDNKGYMALNQTIAGNYNAQPPPYCSAMMNDFETPLNYATVNYNNNSTSGTSSNSISNASYHQLHHHQPQQPFGEYNNLNNLFSGSGNATNALPNLSNELLDANSDGFLTSSSSTTTAAAAAAAHLDNNKMRYDDGLRDYKFTNGPSPNNVSYHHDYHVSGGGGGSGGSVVGIGESSISHTAGSPNVVDYKNLANQIASTISNINSTLSRSRNRNHILTDNLPGPESCV